MPAGSGLASKMAPLKPHFLQVGKGGLPGELADLRGELTAILTPLAGIVVDEWSAPPAASTNAIKLAIASVAAITTYSGSQLDGSVGQGTLSPPRNITITTAGATPADAPANAVINGFDIDGNALSETITVAQTATTAVGNKAFAKVTSIVLPAADGVAATLAFGFGSKIGFSKKLKTRAGLATLVKEIEAGVNVTTGTIADAATGAPYGTYLPPANVPNGARNYAVYYDWDAT